MRLLTLKTVLVATDLTDTSRAALETAWRIAKAAGADLHLVHVSEAGDSIEARAAVSASLASAGVPGDAARVHILEGDPAHAANFTAGKISANLVVLGAHRAHHGSREGLGSTALALVTNSAVPCMVAPSPLRLPLECVVVALDVSDAARGALMVGLSWASALRVRDRGAGGDERPTTRLTALHVRGSDGALPSGSTGSPSLDAQLDRIRQDAGTWAGVAIETVVATHPTPAEAITAFARRHDANLVVLGTRGLGQDTTGRLGSVSASVMQHLQTPVLLVPPAVWMAVHSSG